MTEHGDVDRGLRVRLHVLRSGAECELALAENARFYPSDAALASWCAQAHQQEAKIIYE